MTSQEQCRYTFWINEKAEITGQTHLEIFDSTSHFAVYRENLK